MSDKKEKEKESIDADEVLFKLWFIINAWDDQQLLIKKLFESKIKSLKDLKKISLTNIYNIISSINWNKSDQTDIRKEFIDKIDELKGNTNQSSFDVLQLISSINWDNKDTKTLKNDCLNKISELLNKQTKQIYNYKQQISTLTNQINLKNQQNTTKQAKIVSMQNAIKSVQKTLDAIVPQPKPLPNPYYSHNMNYNNMYGGMGGMGGMGGFGGPPPNPMAPPNPMNYNRGAPPMKLMGAPPPLPGAAAPFSISQLSAAPISMACGAPMRSMAMSAPSMGMMSAPIPSNQNIGFAVGGASDINSFRDNIYKKNRMPQLNSITFEGIYSDYYFDTNSNASGDIDDDNKDNKDDKPLFYPSYCYAKSIIPDALLMAKSNNITKKTNDMIDDDDDAFDFHINTNTNNGDNTEYYMTVGLNSNIKVSDFSRKKLNLVMVLDISGSMGSRFSGMYSGNTKMKTANECVLALLTHLKHDDRFGLVLFDHTTKVHIQFKIMKQHKISDFESILNIQPCGGTNFELGYKAGLNMFSKCNDSNINEYENRMIFATDACPNHGRTDPNSLMGLVKTAATNSDQNKRIYTTFVGIGLDFNANLISEITKVRGAKYFAVHSSAQFFKRLDLEFDYSVSPMVFDLRLILQSEGGGTCIETVYGSNDIDTKSGEIMKIPTLFPSPPSDTGEIKGGIVLIKLKKTANNKYDNLIVECSFENKFGKKFKNVQNVKLGSGKGKKKSKQYYANLGVRKGILLTRYVLLMKEWITTTGSYGSVKVSKQYKQIFKTFKKYFEKEMKFCKDDTLKQEIKLLQKLINHN